VVPGINSVCALRPAAVLIFGVLGAGFDQHLADGLGQGAEGQLLDAVREARFDVAAIAVARPPREVFIPQYPEFGHRQRRQRRDLRRHLGFGIGIDHRAASCC
jgi:hypothetical protein